MQCSDPYGFVIPIPHPGTYQDLGFSLLGDPPNTALVEIFELVTVDFENGGISWTERDSFTPT